MLRLPETSIAQAVRIPNPSAIKTILVPVSGSETDRVVLSAAWTIAQSLQAHLELLHLRLKLQEATDRSAETGCPGDFAREQDNLTTSASKYARQLCREHGIVFNCTPSGAAQISAACLEEDGPPTETLLFHARRNDLSVLGRSQHKDCLPPELIEEVLMNSGRPLLIIPKSLPRPLLGTVVVGWKESPTSARAIAAALPLLQVAQRVVIVNVSESNEADLKALEGVRQQLAWHGIAAEVRRVGEGGAQAERLLPQAVEEMKAGLLVIGGFSHSRLQETVFGGVTSSLVKKAEFPVFIVH